MVSPSKTRSAGPFMRTERSSPTVISSTPPGSLTATGPPPGMRPLRTAATAAAQAPVPQASVRPAPRSHTARSSPPSTGCANPTLTPPGTRRSMAGPSDSARWSTGPSKMTAWGLPMLTRSAWRRSGPTSKSCSPSSRAVPMSTVIASTAPSAPRWTVQRRNPESVSMTRSPSSPRLSARCLATQRMPLPHMAATEPSEL